MSALNLDVPTYLDEAPPPSSADDYSGNVMPFESRVTRPKTKPAAASPAATEVASPTAAGPAGSEVKVKPKAKPFRPEIQIMPGELPATVDEAEAAIMANCRDLFQRGSMVVRPTTTKITVADGKEIEGTRLVQVKRHHLVERMTAAARFKKWDGRCDNWVNTDCPLKVAETYLERDGLWKLPTLAGVINAPTLRRDGSILETPGYDAETGLLFDPAGEAFNPIRQNPSKDDAIEALRFLKAPISTFPFVADEDRSVALAGILSTAVRRSLDTAPLHAFTAPVAGSGKSMLVDIASMIASGRQAPVISQGATEEELEKRLGASLIAGDVMVSIDNCESPLGGELLCQALTQPALKIRILGKSINVEVPGNAAIFATGNNLSVIGDMTRRTLLCSLDPNCERPETREFKVDPLAMIRAERGRYVAAALTILRAFHVADRPRQVNPLGSFESWSDWVRGALIWVGGADPCKTMEKVRATDPKLEALATVLRNWVTVIGEARTSVKEVIDSATSSTIDCFGRTIFQHSAFRESLLVVAGDGGAVNSRRLGKWLSSIKGRMVGGMKIVDDGILQGIGQWKLVRQA